MPILGNCLKCIFKRQEEVVSLDFSNTTLTDNFPEVWQYERTLEDLGLCSTRLLTLPPQLFYCQSLRILNLSNNNLEIIPDAIGTLRQLQHLNISKNFISSIPDNIKNCKNLFCLDLSSNSLQRLPGAITCLLSLQELFLNETYLEFLPANFGRLVNLRILELRLNNLVSLPKSIGRLINLYRIDIGGNEFSELPSVIGELHKLRELWMDFNQIQRISSDLGKLQDLQHFEANGNLIDILPENISNCSNIEVLSVGTNCLVSLPKNLGNLSSLVTLKCELCKLVELPLSISNLKNLEELVVSHNKLKNLPITIGMLRKLRFLFADDNQLENLPDELTSCTALSVLSVSRNKLKDLPQNIGHLTNLKVLNFVENCLTTLPVSLLNLINLSSLWISDNQTQPLVPLQYADDGSNKTRLTCFMLPQNSEKNSTVDSGKILCSNEEIIPKIINNSSSASPSRRICFAGDVDATHNTNKTEQQLAYNNYISRPYCDSDQYIGTRLMRSPTPYPKELRMMAKYTARAAHAVPLRSAQLLNVQQGSEIENRNSENQSTLDGCNNIPSSDVSNDVVHHQEHGEMYNISQQIQEYNNTNASVESLNINKIDYVVLEQQQNCLSHPTSQCGEVLLLQQFLPYSNVHNNVKNEHQIHLQNNISYSNTFYPTISSQTFLTSPPPYHIARNFTKKTQQDLSNYETMRRNQLQQEPLINNDVHESNLNHHKMFQDGNNVNQSNFDDEQASSSSKLIFDNENNIFNNLKTVRNTTVETNLAPSLTNTPTDLQLNSRTINESLLKTNANNNKKTPWLFGAHKNPTVKQIALKWDNQIDTGFTIGNIENEIGIYVTSIVPKSNAARLLAVQDKLLEVNGHDFTNIALVEANYVLQNTGTLLNIMLSRK